MEELKSRLAAYIQMFIDQKRAAGYPYDTSERILHEFDRMMNNKFPELNTITMEVIESWIELKPNEHPNTLSRRIPPVRQLGVYLNGLGFDAYVIPGHVPNRYIKYDAHIYTETELKEFFSAIDSIEYNDMSPTRSFVIPVIFRFLYCCGMRSSEARLLKSTDVNLETGKITIRESKGWRARNVFMSDDLLGISREYNEIIREIFVDREPFFPNRYGKFYHDGILDIWFHEFWDRTHDRKDVNARPCRVHDLRHTFAVHRLNQWVENGEDIQSIYPSFSEYLGHSCFEDTDYYLKLSPSFYPELNKRMESSNAAVLPEALYEEPQ